MPQAHPPACAVDTDIHPTLPLGMEVVNLSSFGRFGPTPHRLTAELPSRGAKSAGSYAQDSPQGEPNKLAAAPKAPLEGSSREAGEGWLPCQYINLIIPCIQGITKALGLFGYCENHLPAGQRAGRSGSLLMCTVSASVVSPSRRGRARMTMRASSIW